jgi:hypothetical protein
VRITYDDEGLIGYAFFNNRASYEQFLNMKVKMNDKMLTTTSEEQENLNGR